MYASAHSYVGAIDANCCGRLFLRALKCAAAAVAPFNNTHCILRFAASVATAKYCFCRLSSAVGKLGGNLPTVNSDTNSRCLAITYKQK